LEQKKLAAAKKLAKKQLDKVVVDAKDLELIVRQINLSKGKLI
jgi:NACalpha-BTF3-like transcription factor